MTPNFRAWHKELKTMFEVKSLVFTLNLATIVSKNDLFPSRTCSFDDIILMQSTGLFDKNGVEIFEGDVVRTERWEERKDFFGNTFSTEVEYQGPVTYLECAFWIEDDENTAPLWSETEEIEIIGNIYEPESVEE